MSRPVISSTGLYTPPHSISNAELVASLNAWTDNWNAEHAEEIAAGELEAKQHSSVEFIEKASGIKSRYVVDKTGVIDPTVMRPHIPERPNDQISILAEIAVAAAKEALERAGKTRKDIDAVICAASNMQRAYPAMAVEVQAALGAEGFAFDMNVACSSATFGIQTGADFVRAGHAKTVLMVNPEICSGHLNFTDRDSHFIFGDVATAVLIEAEEVAPKGAWSILGTHLKTQFSNNIRNNFGFLNRGDPVGRRQAGQAVRPGRPQGLQGSRADGLEHDPGRDGSSRPPRRRPQAHVAAPGQCRHEPPDRRASVLGHEASEEESPTVLDTYANTLLGRLDHRLPQALGDFKPGDKGLICSFGAGYSAGTVFVEKAA